MPTQFTQVVPRIINLILIATLASPTMITTRAWATEPEPLDQKNVPFLGEAIDHTDVMNDLAAAFEQYAVDISAQDVEKIDPKDKCDMGLIPSKIKAPINVTAKIFDGIKITTGGTYDARPSVHGPYIERTDKYLIGLDVNVARLGGHKVPYFFGAQTENTMSLSRLYPDTSECKGYKKIAMSPKNFPLNAEKLALMQPGDQAVLRLKMNLAHGPRIRARIAHLPFGAKFEMLWIVSGLVDINVFMGENNKAHLLISSAKAANNKGPNSKFCLGLRGFSLIQDFLIEAPGLDELFCQKITRENKDLFIADYVFDVKNKYAQEAYNHLFAKTFKAKYLAKAINPTTQQEEVTELTVTNLEAMDALYQQAQVDRKLKGTDSTRNSVEREHKVGFGFFAQQNSTESFREHYVEYNTEAPGQAESLGHMLIPTWKASFNTSVFDGMWVEEDTLRRAFVVYGTDSSYNPTSFDFVKFDYMYSDRTLDQKERKDQLTHFKHVWPESVYGELTNFLYKNYPGFNAGNSSKIREVEVAATYYVRARGLSAIQSQLQAAGDFENGIRKVVFDHIARLPVGSVQDNPANHKIYTPLQAKMVEEMKPPVSCDTRKYPLYNDVANYFGGDKQKQIKISRYCSDIETIVNTLSFVLKPSVDNESNRKRQISFTSLLNNHLFRQIGPGILFSLIPKSELQASTRFELIVTNRKAKDGTNPFVFGDEVPFERELFYNLDNYEKVVTEKDVDMRIPGCKDSPFERATQSGCPVGAPASLW